MSLNRLISTGARIAFAALAGLGCAAIIGAEDLEKVDCVNPGGGACTADAATGTATLPTGAEDGEASSQDATTTAPTDDASKASDATNEKPANPPSGGGGDASTVVDAARDTGVVVVDAGCGPTNTTSNCGACGNVCSTSTSTAQTCNGTKCGYTCKPGRASCNLSGADLDGCECATPSCCPNGACQVTHNNGQGKSYYDCTPVNTYNEAQARAACLAYTGDASQCNLLNCVAGGYNLICSTTNPTSCGCWDFSSASKGHTHVNNAPGLPNCWCPDTNDNSWN